MSVAYVTGASSGIGRGAAVRLAEDGYRVVLLGRSQERLADAAAECGPDAYYAAFDATSAEAVDRELPSLLEQYGAPDVVVHAAGQTVVGALDQLTPQQWHQQMDVNLTSIYLLNRHLWPAQVAAGGGSVVLIASTASFAAFPQDAAYVASKGAVLALTKAMALDGAPAGIRVNAVCPGFILTPNLQGYFDAQDDPAAASGGAAAAAPLGRMGTPADVAGAIAFLASPASSFVTGTSLLVDGGLMARVPG
ncbi:SDR family NAD(P)-dependent oxidoreductase [Kineosporia succinea]|uniref:Meso-butanediol dehydrogenase/(S,S)-butanediol dehydrogenase/diacetyl reductase n=1 Tax=Kineosporia succinea TaxID=84632 RepID=A0ABT9PD24_9ACTN|nr:SDR family NAD(P)-dependent oxidoreductase [Kineosporia succinea]MDP9830598.1 meso-butanediol dehydrogenase/(S,S)-butanediol dehydrogenase/diacetyl reductase [Kineosporia succinea]